ncbi:hypothetical protein GGX14DRAFT_609753 [Mycena pura]|uniref:Uncharacterized protein n=1 Tax=Mycena pura TaxID=153505 RepID=A0AAD6YEB4_9AGAR|nr:hypothetical protein GGX14DRAFT_609753 [Mycena pura]
MCLGHASSRRRHQATRAACGGQWILGNVRARGQLAAAGGRHRGSAHASGRAGRMLDTRHVADGGSRGYVRTGSRGVRRARGWLTTSPETGVGAGRARSLCALDPAALRALTVASVYKAGGASPRERMYGLRRPRISTKAIVSLKSSGEFMAAGLWSVGGRTWSVGSNVGPQLICMADEPLFSYLGRSTRQAKLRTRWGLRERSEVYEKEISHRVDCITGLRFRDIANYHDVPALHDRRIYIILFILAIVTLSRRKTAGKIVLLVANWLMAVLGTAQIILTLASCVVLIQMSQNNLDTSTDPKASQLGLEFQEMDDAMSKARSIVWSINKNESAGRIWWIRREAFHVGLEKSVQSRYNTAVTIMYDPRFNVIARSFDSAD